MRAIERLLAKLFLNKDKTIVTNQKLKRSLWDHYEGSTVTFDPDFANQLIFIHWFCNNNSEVPTACFHVFLKISCGFYAPQEQMPISMKKSKHSVFNCSVEVWHFFSVCLLILCGTQQASPLTREQCTFHLSLALSYTVSTLWEHL